MVRRKKTFFTKKVTALIQNPKNNGTLADSDCCAAVKGECGTTMVFYLKIVNKKIIDATFTTDGCGVSYACGSALTEMIKNKLYTEAAHIAPDKIVDDLGGLPASDLHCAYLSVSTLLAALDDYKENKSALNDK